MTRERFLEILEQLDVPPSILALIMKRDPREVRRWASNSRPIDPAAAEWLEMLAANPPPKPPERAEREALRAQFEAKREAAE